MNTPAKKKRAASSAATEPKTKPGGAEAVAAADANAEEASPYPGLRFYDEDRVTLFAGRDAEVRRCAKALLSTQVLILHGRTGCGKSSFLRAGVKPYLARADVGIQFSNDPDANFEVIRSTDDPLRELGARIYRIADGFLGRTTKTINFGELAEDVEPSELEPFFPDDDAARERVKTDADETWKALYELGSAMASPPIFVIDQAEEVFTLRKRLKLKGDDADDDDDADEDEGGDEAFDPDKDDGLHAAQEENTSAKEYFSFLNRVVSEDTRSRIVISLRTEYKGLFDDQISLGGRLQKQIVGFHLEDLSERGLVEAILRPTMRSGKAWDHVKRVLGLPADTPAPGDAPGAMRIAPKTAKRLAQQLLSRRVPVGGILPTLQAACILLWKQSREGRALRPDYEVGLIELRLLGQVETQVEEYLQRTLEEACELYWSGQVIEMAPRWLHALRDFLVSVEADGRAVTNRTSRNDLVEKVLDRMSADRGNQQLVEATLDYLAQNNVLNFDEAEQRYTLAHDSLALALNKWSLSAPRDTMMMQMGMMSKQSLAGLKEEDLFLNEDKPNRMTIYAHEDYQWDRLLPHFAQHKRFAERLGVTIKTDDDISATKHKEAGWNWPALRDAIVEREKRWEAQPKYKQLRWDENNERILVAADWASFPGEARLTDGGEDARKDFAFRWSDLLVTNLFVGNALVGPDKKFAARLEKARRAHADKYAAEMSDVIKAALQSVIENGSDIKWTNDVGRDLLVFAAELCGDKKQVQHFKRIGDQGRSLRDADYAAQDPLIEHLLKNKPEDKKYIIGTAAARATARQGGYYVYFGTQELAMLAQLEMKRRQDLDYRRKLKAESIATSTKYTLREITEEEVQTDLEMRERVGDLALRVQDIVSHTTWQVGIPASSWDQGLNRAFVLRLAAIGYYTSEYTRTTADEFVGFIHQTVNARDGANQRLMRGAIRDSVRDCYRFYKFDDFGPVVFDLDSTYAYWSDHGNLQTRSVASEIYFELGALRKQTIEHYQTCAEAIGWMRYGGAYDPSHEDVSKAFRLKELAWNNFNIYNFYDAERYMSQAAHALRRCMEKDFTEEPKGLSKREVKNAPGKA